MITVVILGGGFAGVRAALTLRDRVKSYDLRVVIIDKNSFHTFTPALYEVATAEESQKNVIIPYRFIFKHPLEFIEGTVEKIDSNLRKITLDKDREYAYDYLICALGSKTADFDVPGIREYGIPLKTLEDAVQIKDALKHARTIVVGGGGFSGTELACELITHKSNLGITLIQGETVLLKELENEVSQLAKERLEKSNVHLLLGKHINKVTRENVEIENGEIFPYDLFVWTGGVKSNDLLGKVKVDASLKVFNYENVFAAGDIVVPGVAPKAEKMGEIAAENVLRSIKNIPPLNFEYQDIGHVIPLGGHFVAFAMGKFHISGIFAYLLQQFIYLRYLFKIMSFTQAVKKFIKFEKNRVI